MLLKDTNIIADTLGVTLDKTQLNIGGERSLMSPHKEVLIGTDRNTNLRVVLKCSHNALGAQEIRAEHTIRQALANMPFAQEEINMPGELFFGTLGSTTVSITEFIHQEKVFTQYSLQEQFFMGLHALESQESFHATTAEHNMSIRNIFTAHTPDFYIRTYQQMRDTTIRVFPTAKEALMKAETILSDHKILLGVYDGYLMHTDFVPHNFRIHARRLYLLDCVSFRVGNKYESWARFINFMEIHSPELVPLLVGYVRSDRGPQEALVLKMMRIYKIAFLLDYYARALQQTEGDLHSLTYERLVVWTRILEAVISDTAVDELIRNRYYQKRATLRTETERERQKQFTWT
jgi:hypothetical protein